jgi:NTE family protein
MIMQKIVLLFIVLFNIQVFSQQPVIKNLVFEGAGIRGIAYSGVINELESRNLLDSIENVGGTSAGAITAMMLSIGYNSTEIEMLISNTKFNRFNDGNFMFFGGLHRLNNVFGWYKINKFNTWLQKIIYEKTNDKDITFKGLKESGFKNLYVTATNLTQQKLEILSIETYPDMKIRDAVRISMSIPLYFEAAFVSENGQLLDKKHIDAKTNVMVDGGILGNYPIFMFDTFEKDTLQKSKRIANFKTLGVRIDSDSQIEKDRINQELATQKIEKLPDFINAFYNIVIENLNRNELTQEDWQRTISVSSVGIAPKIKKLSFQEKKILIESGKKATKHFFNK